MTLWEIFMARLTDPIGAFIALGLGTFVPPRWIIPAAGVGVATLMEVLLRLLGKLDRFEPVPFILGILAFALWSAIGNLVFRRMMGGASK